MKIKRISILISLALLTLYSAQAQEDATGPEKNTVFNLNYKVAPGDLIQITIEGEADATNNQEVDVNGQVRLIHIDGKIEIAGLTRLNIEQRIVEAYISNEIYKRPRVTVAITNTAPREVFLSGQFNTQGPYAFPPETESLEISELIARAGGMSPIAKSNAVKLTRGDTGEHIIVDVKKILNASSSEKPIYVRPGDFLWVGERIF